MEGKAQHIYSVKSDDGFFFLSFCPVSKSETKCKAGRQEIKQSSERKWFGRHFLLRIAQPPLGERGVVHPFTAQISRQLLRKLESTFYVFYTTRVLFDEIRNGWKSQAIHVLEEICFGIFAKIWMVSSREIAGITKYNHWERRMEAPF